jgi:hypothetical protein
MVEQQFTLLLHSRKVATNSNSRKVRHILPVKLEVVKTMFIFWDVMSSSLLDRGFRRNILPPFSGCSEDGGLINMQTLDSSETEVRICQMSWLHIHEDRYHQVFRSFFDYL